MLLMATWLPAVMASYMHCSYIQGCL